MQGSQIMNSYILVWWQAKYVTFDPWFIHYKLIIFTKHLASAKLVLSDSLRMYGCIPSRVYSSSVCLWHFKALVSFLLNRASSAAELRWTRWHTMCLRICTTTPYTTYFTLPCLSSTRQYVNERTFSVNVLTLSRSVSLPVAY
jgi:hypothetical protein